MDKRREEGTVLLSTLLVLSLMSAVALLLLTTLRQSVTRATELTALAQLDLYAQGARDFAQAQLDELIRSQQGSALNALTQTADPILLPFENGMMSLTVRDGSHCFRLSALSASSGIGSDQAQQRFASLMESLGVDRGRATRLAAAAVDWVDRDSQTRAGGAEDGTYLSRNDERMGPHRTANVPFQSVQELRAIAGMDEALFRRLHPHLCIGTVGAPTQFNIDTAEPRHAPVLSALLGGGPEADQIALKLITSRPSGGYGSIEQLQLAPALIGYENPAAQLDHILFSPDRLVIETMIRYDVVERAELLAYEGLDNGRPNLTYRAWGWDNFPSVAWARLTAETSEGDRRP